MFGKFGRAMARHDLRHDFLLHKRRADCAPPYRLDNLESAAIVLLLQTRIGFGNDDADGVLVEALEAAFAL